MTIIDQTLWKDDPERRVGRGNAILRSGPVGVEHCTTMGERSDYQGFFQSLGDDEPPSVSAELQALWWLRKADWHRAHELVQDIETKAAAHVHAHLHRVEGDLENAGYWYRRAGEPVSDAPLAVEWETLTKRLLDQASADADSELR
jgi:hypothetical protein